MTKQHFIALADAIRAVKPIDSGDRYDAGRLSQWETMTETIANFCAAQNPLFKRGRWLSYIAGSCRPNGRKVKE
jgi:hypothetical protein